MRAKRTLPRSLAPLALAAAIAGCGDDSMSGPNPEDAPDDPQPAPKGVLFTSGRDGNQALYAVDPDSGELRRLSEPILFRHETQAAVSPDGSRIVFVTPVTPAVQSEIVVRNVDGSGSRAVTSTGLNSTPSWSPDGTRILFSSLRSGQRDIFVINADGSGEQNLTNGPADDGDPRWKPDGTEILFVSDRSGTVSLWLMGTDGTIHRQLPTGAAGGHSPSWSPDGSTILFNSDLWGPTEIYSIDRIGIVRRVAPGLEAYDPAWSLDGTRISFFRNMPDLSFDLFVMDVDGSNVLNLSDAPNRSEHTGAQPWFP